MKKKNLFGMKFAIVILAAGFLSPSVSVKNISTPSGEGYDVSISMLTTAEARPKAQRGNRSNVNRSRGNSRNVNRNKNVNRNVNVNHSGGRYYGGGSYHHNNNEGAALVAGMVVGAAVASSSNNSNP